jgi:hypothetical protein
MYTRDNNIKVDPKEIGRQDWIIVVHDKATKKGT